MDETGAAGPETEKVRKKKGTGGKLLGYSTTEPRGISTPTVTR